MDFPGKSPGAGCHFLLQGIFLSQGLNLGLLHWQVDSLPLSHQGNPLHVHLGNFQLCDQLMVCRAGYSSDTFAIVRLFCGVSSKQRALFLPASTLPLEKAMAPHAGTLAWKIPWTEGPGGLQFMGSRRVGDDWVTSLSLFTFMHWRRQWQPTPVFLPGESQGLGSLAGCRLWGRTESDTTEAT